MPTFQESLHNILFEMADDEAERFESNKQKLREALEIIIAAIKKNFATAQNLQVVKEINKQFKAMEGGNAESAKWLGDRLVKMLQAGQSSFPILTKKVNRSWAEVVGDEMSQYLQRYHAFGDEEALDVPGLPTSEPQEPGPYSSSAAQEKPPEYETYNEDKFNKALSEIMTIT